MSVNHLRPAFALTEPREDSRRATPWRWLTLAFALTTVVLAGLLMRAQQPGPTRAAELYNNWSARMTMMLSTHLFDGAIAPAAVARDIQAPNAQAGGIVAGFSVSRSPLPHDVALLAAYLANINDYLDRLIYGYWTDAPARRTANAARIQRLVRGTLFARLPHATAQNSLPVPDQMASDSAALDLSPRLCGVAADIARAWYRAYVTGGLTQFEDARLRTACARGQPIP